MSAPAQANAVSPRALLSRGCADGERTAWIITFSEAAAEPRALRQAWSLSRAGWRVVICGREGKNPLPAAWSFVKLAELARPPGRAETWMRRIGYKLAGRIPAGAAARLLYQGLPNWAFHSAEILRIAAENPDLRPRLVIAHDHPACPPADALASRYGARFIVDAHEYMLGALMEDEHWRTHERPFIKVMQDHYFARADQVVTVSAGIAERLDAEQRLRRPTRVVRSLPFYEAPAFRAVGETVTVLYHGLVNAYRDLDIAIEAAALWRPDKRLIIRGPGDEQSIERLSSLIAERGVGPRVSIEPPVPFAQLISRASEADIGYFVYRDGSPQRRSALPNKFFEYVMAGLALCVSDLPEMARLVRRYDLGVVTAAPTATAVAAALDSLTPRRIEAYKRASIEAARELSWDREQAAFLDIVDALCGPASPPL